MKFKSVRVLSWHEGALKNKPKLIVAVRVTFFGLRKKLVRIYYTGKDFNSYLNADTAKPLPFSEVEKLKNWLTILELRDES